MGRSVTVVIPAHDEAETIAQVVASMRRASCVKEVIVVDNCCVDGTADLAALAGATVIPCGTLGMGAAMKAGIAAASSATIVKIDGDIRDPNPAWVNILAGALGNECWFCSGDYESDDDEFPMNILVASPPLRIFFPELRHIRLPLSGVYAFNRELMDWRGLPDDSSFDIGLLVSATLAGERAQQKPIGRLNDRRRRIGEYAGMAGEVLTEILRQAAHSGRLEEFRGSLVRSRGSGEAGR